MSHFVFQSDAHVISTIKSYNNSHSVTIQFLTLNHFSIFLNKDSSMNSKGFDNLNKVHIVSDNKDLFTKELNLYKDKLLSVNKSSK